MYRFMFQALVAFVPLAWEFQRCTSEICIVCLDMEAAIELIFLQFWSLIREIKSLVQTSFGCRRQWKTRLIRVVCSRD